MQVHFLIYNFQVHLILMVAIRNHSEFSDLLNMPHIVVVVMPKIIQHKNNARCSFFLIAFAFHVDTSACVTVICVDCLCVSVAL